ncbi:hypothetical protein BDN72DRAFT_957739 [Pluteus cervinus]|uniref:Uncharacterized protein n=1 Tax=Pluteus cervinus TaxID=181527 RepID=A0ACD3B264_9AGAR|nr:hypothetical protein BDN72DRAFT_957739 [Pluteus cervinus]
MNQQRPTLQNVRIRSTRDALQVFHGVATNRLPLITRRLDAEERRAIVAGNVYVWEERGANTEPTGLGMERWTDGMGWGPSRVRDEFLFYHQKESDVGDDHINPVTPWDMMMRRRDPPRPGNRHDSEPAEPERLIKQTYSVHVFLPVDQSRGIVRKWHLTAYFSQSKLEGLRTIDNIPGVGDVVVPEGWFRSARAVKGRRETNRRNSDGGSQAGEGSMVASSSGYPHYSPPRPRHGELPTSHSMTHSPAGSDYSGTLPSSSSSPIPGSGVLPQFNYTSQLVPLEFLQNLNCPRRDPTDEQFLRRFGSSYPGQGSTPPHSQHPPS